MRLSQVGWTIAIVSCITSRSVKVSELQRVQNAAARIARDLSKFCHITPALRQLHWLPVIKRIQFNILFLSFKAIHGPFPPYISELVTVKPNLRTVTVQATVLCSYLLHRKCCLHLVLAPFAAAALRSGTNCLLILEMLLP